MALTFNPPEWLIQEYMQRKSPVERLGDTLNTISKDVANRRAQSDQQKQLAIQTLATLYGEGGPDLVNRMGGPIARQAGVDVSGFSGPKPATNVNIGLTAGTVNPQTNEIVTSSGSSAIDAWNKIQGGTSNPAGLPQDALQRFAVAGEQGKFGDRQRQNLMSQMTFAKGLKDLNEDPNAPVPTMTREQALKAGQVNPKTKILDDGSRQDDKMARNSENQLRSQFLTQSKDFNDMTRGYQRVIDSSKDPSAAGDLALLFGYMKMLDPGSVVRETEFANAENSAGVPEKIRQVWNKALSGERLTPAMRKDFLNQASGLYKGQLSVQKRNKDEFGRIAAAGGLDPNRVIVDTSIPVQEFSADSGPQVGTVEDGYRFIGGNPSDPKSWVKI